MLSEASRRPFRRARVSSLASLETEKGLDHDDLDVVLRNLKGATSWLNGLKNLAKIFLFRHLQSVPIFSILNHPGSFMVYYYPTALRRVQITLKTSTNITRYLYSRGPVKQVSCHWPISSLDFPRQFSSASHTSIALSLWINTHEIRSHEHTNLAFWIINLLLDVLLCSIAGNFYSLFVFWLALRARQNTAQLVKILSDTTQQNV